MWAKSWYRDSSCGLCHHTGTRHVGYCTTVLYADSPCRMAYRDSTCGLSHDTGTHHVDYVIIQGLIMWAMSWLFCMQTHHACHTETHHVGYVMTVLYANSPCMSYRDSSCGLCHDCFVCRLTMQDGIQGLNTWAKSWYRDSSRGLCHHTETHHVGYVMTVLCANSPCRLSHDIGSSMQTHHAGYVMIQGLHMCIGAQQLQTLAVWFPQELDPWSENCAVAAVLGILPTYSTTTQSIARIQVWKIFNVNNKFHYIT
jgi:hypothetical protein